MTITNKYITNNRPYEKRSKTTAIAVHYIGNPNTSAEANRNYFQNTSNEVSSNYIIGLNGEIICCIPDEEVAWCTNQANSYSISIECCHPDSTGKFNDKTYDSLVELCVYLCKKYKLDETNLIRHYDVTGKVCPKSFVPQSKGGSDDNNNSAWKKFKADVKAKLNISASATASAAKDKMYRIRKSWSDTSSQIGAYANLANAKKACKSGYTVYDWLSEIEKRLKSGAGVVIEHKDFENLIKVYDRQNALFYCDQPYHKSEGYYSAGFCSGKIGYTFSKRRRTGRLNPDYIK